ARTTEPKVIAVRAFLPSTSFGTVSVSPCAIAWAEPRDDGTEDVDIRLQRIDPSGEISTSPTFANVATRGTWLVPTVVCASPTRAFATFFDQANQETGNLYFRRLP